MADNTPLITPIQLIDGVYVKRDDLFCMAGIRGGKVRACRHLATNTTLPPAHGLITASARRSPQAQIVARLAHRCGIPARCHMPQGERTEEMVDMVAHGGILVQHKAGYNNVIIARAKEDHKARPGWRYIPFGMEHVQAMACTRQQVQNIPTDVKRVVVCVGSGMSAAGILHGLQDAGIDLPMVGIRIGADPTKRLNSWAPFGWHNQLEIVDVTDSIPYHTGVEAHIGGILLDPHYEAKCLPYLKKNDLFWIVGIRATKETQ